MTSNTIICSNGSVAPGDYMLAVFAVHANAAGDFTVWETPSISTVPLPAALPAGLAMGGLGLVARLIRRRRSV